MQTEKNVYIGWESPSWVQGDYKSLFEEQYVLEVTCRRSRSWKTQDNHETLTWPVYLNSFMGRNRSNRKVLKNRMLNSSPHNLYVFVGQVCCHWIFSIWCFIMIINSHCSNEWHWWNQHFCMCFISLVILLGQGHIWKLQSSLTDQSSEDLSLYEMRVCGFFS